MSNMDVSSLVEDIVSDEYEEGEILDNDIMYENVSSLEEFSDSGSDRKLGREARKVWRRRKKEHKCKEDSLCRRERSGKHCYARIRKKCVDVKPRPSGKSYVEAVIPVHTQSTNRPLPRSARDAVGEDSGKVFRSRVPLRRRGQNSLRRGAPRTAPRRPERVRKCYSKSPTTTTRATAKSSLLDRLVGSGSIPGNKPLSTEKVMAEPTPPLADIPVPPTPVHEPQTGDIEELHLRLFALKTAIIKKHSVLKRKKMLASSNRKSSFEPVDDSFTEFVLLEADSMSTPPPPGTDGWPVEPRWSDEDAVLAELPSSGTLGDPIPVVTPHRPAKGSDERRLATTTPGATVIAVPCTEDDCPSTTISLETPKYLKEIHLNKSGTKKRRSDSRHRRRRTSPRQATSDKSHKAKIPEDDEDELRKLALMSVKPKNAITGGLLSNVGSNLNPLRVETDLPATKTGATTVTTNEGWEELDEDILRAQLLSSLSQKFPTQPPTQPIRPVNLHYFSANKINKENVYLSKGLPSQAAASRHVKRNLKQFKPPLGQFIIKVSDSSEDEDEDKLRRDGPRDDIELSIDKLLEDTRKETELLQMAASWSESRPAEVTSSTEDPVLEGATPRSTVESSIPHLSTWQQAEWERQRQATARHEVLVEAAKLRIRQKRHVPTKSGVDEVADCLSDLVRHACDEASRPVVSSTSTMRPQLTKTTAPAPLTCPRPLSFNKTSDTVPVSSLALKTLNVMTDMVAGFEKDVVDYVALKRDFLVLRKQLSLAHRKMTRKRGDLLVTKGRIEAKRRLLQSTISMDTSALSPLPDSRESSKLPGRAAEYLNLKFKEVCLRAQFASMGLENGVRPPTTVEPSSTGPPDEPARKRPRPRLMSKSELKQDAEPPQPGTSQKIIISVRDKDRMNPLIPLCPYDVKGVCKDEECKYQHLRTE